MRRSGEVERFEDDMGGAIAVRCLELVADVAIGGERQALFRDRRAADVTAQPLEPPLMMHYLRPGTPAFCRYVVRLLLVASSSRRLAVASSMVSHHAPWHQSKSSRTATTIPRLIQLRTLSSLTPKRFIAPRTE